MTPIIRARTATMMASMNLFLFVTMVLSTVSAFHSTRLPYAMVAQEFSRSDSTDFYRSNDNTGSRKRTKQQQIPSITTSILHYSSDATAESASSSQEQSWWKSWIPTSIQDGTTAGTGAAASSSTGSEMSQQETVDAYLEFLDRRYKRIHSSEIEAVKRKQQPREQSKSVPFSAMDWLLHGSSSEHHHTQQQQQEDALYVLGVAGLASQKLLQKHHLHNPVNNKAAAISTTATIKDDVIEVQAVDDEQGVSTTATPVVPSHIFVKKVLVPLVRAIYIIQRQKQLLVQKIQRKAATVASGVAQRVFHPFATTIKRGPKAILDTFLNLGGGKKTVLLTLAGIYTAVFILQPLFQTILTEGSVRP